MIIDHSLLEKIKTNLRISHDKLDGDLGDAINACLQDLKICGVNSPMQEDPQEMDALIINAIKLYCRAEFTDDTTKAAAYKERYDSLKSCLMMASEYREEAVTDE